MVETTYDAQIRQIAAFDDLLGYFQGQKPRWDGDVAAAQAAYGALSNDLKGVVKDLMFFPCTVDPDEANPTNVRGGVFNNIISAILAAPSGSYVSIGLVAGKVHPVETNVFITSKTVVIARTGAGDKPIILIKGSSDGSSNRPIRFNSASFSSIRFLDVEIEYDQKVNPALPWSASPLISPSYGTQVSASFYGTNVTGHEGAFLTSTYAGSTVFLNLGVVTLDGVIGSQVSLGTLIVGQYNVTLLNGALIQDGGTVGQDVFMN